MNKIELIFEDIKRINKVAYWSPGLNLIAGDNWYRIRYRSDDIIIFNQIDFSYKVIEKIVKRHLDISYSHRAGIKENYYHFNNPTEHLEYKMRYFS